MGTLTDPGYPTIPGDAVGWLTEDEMIEVDRVMIDDLHIELVQMMENAGRNLARFVLDVAAPARVAVVCGPGGNGGGGLVAARHLANAGVDVVVTLASEGLSGVPGHQLDILGRMGVPTSAVVAPADVTIDALIGYSLRGAPRGRTGELIAQFAGRTTVALDTPSGLDVTTGTTPGAVVTADATLTLALPKRGLRGAAAVGALFVADISVPPAVTSEFGPAAPDFARSPIVRVDV